VRQKPYKYCYLSKYFFFTVFFLLISIFPAIAGSAGNGGLIVAPSVKDTLLTGGIFIISWNNPGNSPTDIYYSTDKGDSWQTIITSFNGNNYNWTVPNPDILQIRLKVIIRGTDNNYLAASIPLAHNGEIRSICFSPDGSTFLTSSADGYIKVWNSNSMSVANSVMLPGSRQPYSACFLHTKDTVIISTDSSVYLWSVPNSSIVRIDSLSFQDIVRRCATHPTKNLIAAASYDGWLKVYSLDEDKIVSSFITPDTSELYFTTFSRDGTKLLSSGYSGKVYLIDWTNGKVITEFDGQSTEAQNKLVWSCDISPDNKTVISGGVDNTVRIFDAVNGSEIRKLYAHTFHVRSVRFHPLGQMFLSASLDSTLKFWNIDGTQTFGTLNHKSQIISADYSPTGDSILTSGRDGSIKLWVIKKSGDISDSLDCIIKRPATISIPDMTVICGSTVSIPVTFKCDYIKNNNKGVLSGEILVELPSFVNNAIPGAVKDGLPDTVHVILDNIDVQDTLATITATIDYTDIPVDSVRIIGFVPAESDYYFRTNNGIITVVQPDLPPLTINPNPVDGPVQFLIYSKTNCAIDIVAYDIRGNFIKNILTSEVKVGMQTFDSNFSAYASGYYLIVCNLCGKTVSMPLLIVH
jgi:WD40 repeat protein